MYMIGFLLFLITGKMYDLCCKNSETDNSSDLWFSVVMCNLIYGKMLCLFGGFKGNIFLLLLLIIFYMISYWWYF